MIQAKHVRIDGRLNDFTLTVEKGRAAALLGGAGAGKTAAMDVLSGAAEADGGETGGEKCPCMTQKSSLFEDMTLRANLKFACDLEGLGHAQADERIRELARDLGFEEYLDKSSKVLSQSVSRRAALAMALICGGENLLLDEPTAGLDSGDALRLRRVIASLKADRAILIATRSVTEAERLADVIYIMKDGRIAARCESGQLDKMAQDAHTVRARLLCTEAEAKDAGAERVEAAFEGVWAYFPCDDPAALLPRLLQKGVRVAEFGPAPLDVEDIVCGLEADAYSGEAEA